MEYKSEGMRLVDDSCDEGSVEWARGEREKKKDVFFSPQSLLVSTNLSVPPHKPLFRTLPSQCNAT